MVRRVVIGEGASSPFVVSVSGYDAASANFQRTIFSADQMPFRLMAKGIISSVPPAELGQGLNQKQGSIRYSFGGRYPVVLVATQNEAYEGNGGPIAAGPISSPYIAVNNTRSNGFFYYQSGAGLVVRNDGWLYGLNANEKFQIATPNGPILVRRPPVRIYYAIMKNLG